jgi:Fe-S-cluster containining protein
MERARAEVISLAVGEILARVDAEIAERRPVCRASGRCCRFEEYGHRLYVSTAELLHFAHHHVRTTPAVEAQNAPSPEPSRRTVSLAQFFENPAPAGCPYQVDGLCTAREARPLGCRIYFCDETAQRWQEAVYEKYHGEFKALHERLRLPYRYIEWRAALKELLDEDPREG